MPKQPVCSCNQHSEFSKDKQFSVCKRSSRKFSKDVDDALQQKGYLSSRALYLCSACADYAHENFVLPPSEKRTKYSTHYVQTILDMINSGNIEDDDLSKIVNAICKHKTTALVDDANVAAKQYKDETFMDQFDPRAWLQNRNQFVVELLKSLCGIDDISSVNTRKLLSFVKMYEQLLLCCCENVIFPLSFSINLLAYFSTGSKSVVDMSNAVSPSGSYTTLLNWINERSVTENKPPENHDIFTFFDNNQVLSRNWRVTFDHKSSASVITNVLHILPSVLSDFQNKIELRPSSWLYDKSREELVLLLKNLQSESNEIFRKYRSNFISERIAAVSSESNLVQVNVSSKATMLSQQPYDSSRDKYSFIADTCAQKPTSVVLGDPLMENPCSYEAVKTILNSIIHTTCNTREWSIAGCDGSPFILASRLMDRCYVCRFCNTEFNNDASFKNHINQTHPKVNIEQEMKECKKYGKILLVPGLGHIEINMVKCIFKLLWPIMLKDLGTMLGYRTIRAQNCCQNASDHHKAMMMLEICLFALSDEVIHHYCNFAKENKLQPTADGYFKFLEDVKNENYIFASEIAFTYLFAIYLFRAAVRRNNSALIMACRIKFAPLFFGTNMTHYQELHIRDCLMRVCMPQDVKHLINDNESFSCSGHPSKGEGGDFILEAKNRRTKMWMPPGVPTESRWVRVCRNQDRLEKLKEDVSCMLGISSSSDLYHYNLNEEIFQWRTKIRSSGYLQNPKDRKPLTCLNNDTEVDNDLINFSYNANQNLNLYLSEYEKSGLFGKGPEKLTPIFVLPQDREKFFDLSKKSKPTLEKEILNTLDKINTTSEDVVLEHQWETEVKRGSKEDYITFYKELLQAVDEATTDVQLDVDDDIC